MRLHYDCHLVQSVGGGVILTPIMTDINILEDNLMGKSLYLVYIIISCPGRVNIYILVCKSELYLFLSQVLKRQKNL